VAVNAVNLKQRFHEARPFPSKERRDYPVFTQPAKQAFEHVFRVDAGMEAVSGWLVSRTAAARPITPCEPATMTLRCMWILL
jgi:hypothetical protein